MTVRISILLALIIYSSTLFGQGVKNIIIDGSDNGKVFSDFLLEKEATYNVDFIFDEERLQALTVKGITKRMRIIDYLDYYLVQYTVTKITDDVVFIVDKQWGEQYGWRKDNYAVLKKPTEGTVSITGTLIDGGNDEPIIGAQVIIAENNVGVLTNADGHFEFNTIPEIQLLEIRYIGYEPTYLILGFSDKSSLQTITQYIFQRPTELENVVISAERPDQNVISQITGVERMGIETIKTLPTFLGEVDPIKGLTTLPGVSMVGELSSGFNVRGGETGQNLILQDGATIYNPSHLFGFFSAFNPDMVSDVMLYKGGGPAKYGSRVASILDVKLRNGDAGRHRVSGGVGLVSSRLTAEGPIVKNKSSYLIGGRISYSNWLLKVTDDIQLQNSSAQFYDVTAKIFHTMDEDNILTLSLYNSRDDFQLASDSTFAWQTFNGSARWDHAFNNKLSSSMILASSNYTTEVDNPDKIAGFTYQNKINNIHLKYDVSYSKEDNFKLLAGFETEGILIEPGVLKPLEEGNNAEPADMNDQRALESAVYIQSDWPLSNKLALTGGIRFSNFLRIGRDEIYQFDYSNIISRYPQIIDSVSYGQGEIIENFSGWEPRISLRYLLSETTSLKASYYRGFQYLHLISNTTSTTPQDYWIASGPYLEPAIGNQYTLGIFKNAGDNTYEVSLEGFYKLTEKVVDYIEGADISLNPSLEAGLVQGKGKAYGVEFLLKKNRGQFYGWVSYTFSRSLRRFSSESYESMTINNGDYYPATYDQPHNLSLIFNYRLGPNTVLSSNFSYSTGRPITIPVSKFSYGSYLSVLNYSERNKYRIPDYHRLDLSLTIKDKPRNNKRFKGEWVISIFNVYGRKNAYSISFDKYGKASKLSILGSIFPSVSYNFSF